MQQTTQRRTAITRHGITWLLAAILALSVATAAPASAAPTVSRVRLQSRQIYTSSGVTLRAGDSVTIRASGTIHFGGGKIQAMTPPGIPRGAECDAIARNEPRKNPWPAADVSCWSLIARIGAGKPFEIGSEKSFRASQAGPLLLGLNDNFVDDNSGTWQAIISVTAAPTTTPTTPVASTPTKSSHTVAFVLIGVALLALLLILAWARQRTKRRRGGAPPAAVAADAAPEMFTPLPPETVADLAAAGAVAVAVASAPPETDSIDVNIFEVEFSNGLTLRVGYNHFPEGTELRWRVTQNRVAAAAGSFITKGGGSTNHVETVPLGVKLESRATHPDGADVQFDWSINGVPFRYSVRRDTNC